MQCNQERRAGQYNQKFSVNFGHLEDRGRTFTGLNARKNPKRHKFHTNLMRHARIVNIRVFITLVA